VSWTGQGCFYVTQTLDFLQSCGLVTSHVPLFGGKPLKICECVYPGKKENNGRPYLPYHFMTFLCLYFDAAERNP